MQGAVVRPAEPQLAQNRIRRLVQIPQREKYLVLRNPDLVLAQKQQPGAGLGVRRTVGGFRRARGLVKRFLHDWFAVLWLYRLL
jgi:hypothetical protein